jgi:hypothetical protein
VISVAGLDFSAMRHPIVLTPTVVPLAGFLSSCAHPWIEIKRYF